MKKLKVTWDVHEDPNEEIEWAVYHSKKFKTKEAVVARTPHRELRGKCKISKTLTLDLTGVARGGTLIFVTIGLENATYTIHRFNQNITRLHCNCAAERSYSR